MRRRGGHVANATTSGRRDVAFRFGLFSVGAWVLGESSCDAIPLAPLGKALSYANKRTDLKAEEVKDVLEKGLRAGKYFINSSGMPTEVFDDDCRFVDPTNDVVGLSRYVKALDLLFVTENSQLDLLEIAVVDSKTIEAKYVLGGYLKFPWKPCVKPYSGVVTYTLGTSGLVEKQEQTWSISGAEALKETFSACPNPKINFNS